MAKFDISVPYPTSPVGAPDVTLPRPLQFGGEDGPDVIAYKRAISRLGRWPWTAFNDTYTREFAFGRSDEVAVSGVKGFQAQSGLEPDGDIGTLTFEQLRITVVPPGLAAAGQFALDRTCLNLLTRASTPPAALVFPFLEESHVGVDPAGLHVTDGIAANWALDFMCAGGTPVVACEDVRVVRLSGRDPAQGADQKRGLFGFNTHFETSDGYRYFTTHFGKRAPGLAVGDLVNAGDLLGEVGSWPDDPPRSHCHLGVTSPRGEVDAQRRIQAVARAPRIR